MNKHVIFLRKKIEGENSIEEVAYHVAESTGAIVKVLPFSSTTIRGMKKNIDFAKKEQGEVNHIIAQTESYIAPFLHGKKIITFHDFETLYASRNLIYKVLKILFYVKSAEYFADVITFVSKQTKEEFKKQQWNKRKKLQVIYNTYDARLICNDKSSCEILPIVLQIGTGKRKNLESTIQAMIGLNAKLLIIGKLHENQIRLLNENNILYENYFDVSFEKIVESYNRAKIVVFPTFYEGFGLPIIEAQVMQKPIVASDLSIVKEVGGNGVFYINPNDVESIKKAIHSLLENQDLYQRYVFSGIENAKRFSSESIYEQYQNLYRSLEK